MSCRTFALALAVGAAVLATGQAEAQSFRVEGGLGGTSGQNNMTLSSPTLGGGNVNLNALGGSGLAANAAVWADDIGIKDLSLGAQYLYFDNSGSATASLAGTSLNGNLDQTTHAFMVNAAWRPSEGYIHPFAGVGIGVAFNTLGASASVGGLGLGSSSNSQTNFAGQVFLGFDYDITSNLYAGLTGRFFITEPTYAFSVAGTQLNVANTSEQIALMAHIGWKF